MSALEVNLAPGLLISMPQLSDPFFGRAVVLMIEHSDEGSFGLIINSESDLVVSRLLGALEIEWHGDPEKTVWSGGPVLPSSGWVLHESLDDIETTDVGLEEALAAGRSIRISDQLCLSTTIDNLRIVSEAKLDASKFILGYSGWSAGQLAAEMARGSWLHADIDPKLVFHTPADEIWAGALKSLGVDPEAVIQTRGVH